MSWIKIIWGEEKEDQFKGFILILISLILSLIL